MAEHARILELVEHVLDSDQSPEEICAGDLDLLPAVRERLKHFRALSDHLENIFPSDAADNGSQTNSDEQWRSTGFQFDRLGEYRILREIGRGGMGVVYEAIQESLGRHVALKVLSRRGPADALQVERFRREARSAALLHHSAIVPVYDVGVQDGVHYYVMQYIHGRGLNQVLADLRRSQRATIDGAHHVSPGSATAKLTGSSDSVAPDHLYFRNVARIGARLAEALAYAHGQRILHRDIKPANILLAEDGGVWICDFGLAKLEGDELTQSGDLVGTFRYMAPERLSGHSDVRSDVYSLGLTLYEMLALRPAFDEPDRVRLIRQINEDDPVRPSQFVRHAPRDLETIVLKSIAKSPRNRYPSAAALAEDLERFLAGRPVAARPAGLWERGWKWAKRRPASAAALAVSVLALAAIAAMAVGFTMRLKTERDLAETQRARAEASYNLAREAMDRGLKKVRDDPRLEKGELQDLRQKMIQVETEFLEQFVQLQGDDSTFQARRADAFLRLGRVAMNFDGTHSDAIANFRRAIEVDRSLVARENDSPKHRKHLADGLFALGCQLRYMCQLDPALAAHREAEELLGQLLARDPGNSSYRELLASVLDDRALCEQQIGSYAIAREAVLRAEPMWMALTEQFPQNQKFKWRETVHWFRAATTHEGPDANQKSEADFLKALSLAEKLLAEAPTNPEYRLSVARPLIQLGLKYRNSNRLELALKTLQRADALCENLINEYPSVTHFLHDCAMCRGYLGLSYADLREFDLSVEWFRKSIQLYERLHREHPDVLRIASDLGHTCTQLGIVLNELGKKDDSIPALDRAIEVLEQAYPSDLRLRIHIERLVNARWERGYSRYVQSRYAEARPDYDRAVELAPTNRPPRLYWQRAEIMARLGNHRGAFAELEKKSAGDSWDGNQCVYLARVARACRRALDSDKTLSQHESELLADRYDAHAVQWLAHAKTDTHFADSVWKQNVIHDADFEPLRNRADFRKLFPET